MKYQACDTIKKKIEEREKNIIGITSLNSLDENESISDVGVEWKIFGLKHCEKYKFNINFKVDKIKPSPKIPYFNNSFVELTMSTAPVLILNDVTITPRRINLNFKSDCTFIGEMYFYALLTGNGKQENKTMNEMSNTLSVEFSSLEPETEYEIKVVGKNKSITDSYTEGWKFVNFPDIFHYKFKTYAEGKDIYEIKRTKTSLESGVNRNQTIIVQNLKTGDSHIKSSNGGQLIFNNLHACADYNISTNSFNMVFNGLTHCQCPEKRQELSPIKERINDLTIQITWPSVETPNHEYLCGFETYVLYNVDRKLERTSNNFYEFSLCKIYYSSNVRILALSNEGIILGEGAIDVPEIQEAKLSELLLEFKPNLIPRITYINASFTRTVLDKYKMCYFEVKVDGIATKKTNARFVQQRVIEALDYCTTYDVELKTTLVGHLYDERKITFQTPMKEFEISHINSNYIVKLCPNETNQFLAYKLKVTWIKFIEQTTCSENEPVEKVKSYNSSGGDIKLDKLLSNSKYNLELDIFHKGFSGRVIFYEKSISTSSLSPHKISILSMNVDFRIEENCEPGIKISWTKPCVTQTYIVTATMKNEVDPILSIKTTDEFLSMKNLQCGKTYKICVTPGAHKEHQVCDTINTIREIKLNFDDVFVRESAISFYINRKVIQKNRDMIQEAKIELIDKSCSPECVFVFSKSNWNPFKTRSSDKVRFTVGPHSIPSSDVENYEIIPFKSESDNIRLTLVHKLGHITFTEDTVVKTDYFWLIPVVIGLVLLVVISSLIALLIVITLNSCLAQQCRGTGSNWDCKKPSCYGTDLCFPHTDHTKYWICDITIEGWLPFEQQCPMFYKFSPSMQKCDLNAEYICPR
uniref:CSON011703 protein n=1 Tax=Culicoides sonorensis TaxID=179676 RepID=A0A336LZA0_CULSO